MDDFDREMKAIESAGLDGFVDFHKGVTTEALRLAQDGSPEWTGRYKASLAVTDGDPDSVKPLPEHPEVVSGAIEWPTRPASPYRAQSPGVIADGLDGLKLGGTTHLVAPVPYADEIEFGSSQQAPQGVLNVAANAANVRFSK